MKKMFRKLIFWRKEKKHLIQYPYFEPYVTTQYIVENLNVTMVIPMREMAFFPKNAIKEKMVFKLARRLEEEGFIEWEEFNHGYNITILGSLRIIKPTIK
jgi:hypothetical protein